MTIELSDTQRELGDMVGRLMRDKYAFAERQKIRETEGQLSKDIWATFADLGLLSIALEEDKGGLGGGYRDVAVAMEEFGKALCLEPFLANAVLAASVLVNYQESARLSEMTSGKRLFAYAHGELDARYCLSHVKTKAIEASGGHKLTGQKSIVLGGDVADTFIVSARTSEGDSDRSCLSLFMVDRDSSGLEVRSYRTIDDLGAAEITLTEAQGQILGRPGDALNLIEKINDLAVAAICAEAVGAMQSAFDMTLDYIKTRNQFGAAIGSFQALQHKAVDMLRELQHARSMALLAASYADEENPDERSRHISAAKIEVDRSARNFGQLAIQLHGGIGLTEECAISHYFRRLTAIGLSFGDIDYHADRFAALTSS